MEGDMAIKNQDYEESMRTWKVPGTKKMVNDKAQCQTAFTL